MQGTNNVIVTIATNNWAGERSILKKPAAPKSLRTKPITNAVAASAGNPSHPTVNGSSAALILTSAPVTLSVEIRSEPATKNSVTSFMKCHTLVTVLRNTLSTLGSLSDGMSMSRSVVTPGVMRASTVPTPTKIARRMTKYAAA